LSPFVVTYAVSPVSENITVTVDGISLNAYAVGLPIGTGYAVTAEPGSISPVSHGGEFKFRVALLEGYAHSAPVVKANGTLLTSESGVYTVTNVAAAVTVTVESVHTGTPGLGFSPINGGAEFEVSRGTATAVHVVIPDIYQDKPVRAVAEGGFLDYTAMSGIEFPVGITEIGAVAFVNTGLLSVVIPASVIRIGAAAFAGCNRLKDFAVDAENPAYRSAGACLIQKLGEVLIAGCMASVIPDGIIGIGEGAFAGLAELESIQIPDSVKVIGEGAFLLCVSVTAIVIPGSVTEISDSAFAGCEGLVSVVMQGEAPPAIGKSAFDAVAHIYVPDSALEAYKAGWGDYAAQIFPQSERPGL